jgi:hypothetical protein
LYNFKTPGTGHFSVDRQAVLNPFIAKGIGGVRSGRDQETVCKDRSGGGRKCDDQWPGIHGTLQ